MAESGNFRTSLALGRDECQSRYQSPLCLSTDSKALNGIAGTIGHRGGAC